MRSLVVLVAVTVPWAGAMAISAAEANSTGAVDYLRDVKPLLMRRCQSCHGPLKQEAGLRLDAASLISRGGDSGPVVVPSRSGESLLVEAVTRTEGRMPLEGEPLSADEVRVLARWIDQGATAPGEPPPPDPRDHWAYRPPQRPAVPTAAPAGLMVNPIDAFLEAARSARGLIARPPADRRVLLRRVTLDLVGLPPAREEMNAFLADTAPGAYERVVDRLLASPQYGERWGRHWMDVWRYSDWAGYGPEVRDSQQHIWRWRDWIVRSLNEDRGYDRMIVEMLAGDEVAPDDPATLAATGFLARNWYRFNRNVWLDNTVEHTSKAFLGLTANCARCHDHMYDPIAQAEYYQLRAFFEPYDVRTDRVAGQLDVAKDGLARVYDAQADSPTYLFFRGQDSQPDKEKPLAPAVPAILGGARLVIQPVALPPTAYYPALRPEVREDLLAHARNEVGAAEAAGQAAEKKLAEARLAAVPATTSAAPAAEPAAAATPPRGDSPAQVEQAAAEAALAARRTAAAQARLAALVARIAADDAKYATPPAADAATLATRAAAAVRQAQLCDAEVALAKAEAQLVAAQSVQPPTDKSNQDAAAAQKAIAEARTALVAAQPDSAPDTAEYPAIETMYPTNSTGRRLALARWIADRQNPLTARVAINHMWLRHFGEPLVSTVFDFGLNGQPPSHPELLDWLAVEFMEQGWSMKSIHRLMVTSQAYRMQSTSGDAAAAKANVQIDPDNRWLWRMNARRMEAEVVRDSVWRLGGQLDLTMGGPDLDFQQGLTVGRRSIYFRHAHDKQMTFLQLFDAASVAECYRRSESVVPQQALALANSPVALSQSRLLAGRLWEESKRGDPSASAEAFVQAAFETVLGRPARDDERQACLEFLAAQAGQLSDPARLTAIAGGEAAAVKPAADPLGRARESLVHVLFNHNDFVTIR